MKGSMTVEAAYIVPLCWLIIGIIGCLGIFQYNQAVLKITAYECLIQSERNADTEDAVYKKILQERAEELGNQRTLAVKDLKADIKVTASKASITYRCTQTMLNIPIELTVVYERTFPELTLRFI